MSESKFNPFILPPDLLVKLQHPVAQSLKTRPNRLGAALGQQDLISYQKLESAKNQDTVATLPDVVNRLTYHIDGSIPLDSDSLEQLCAQAWFTVDQETMSVILALIGEDESQILTIDSYENAVWKSLNIASDHLLRNRVVDQPCEEDVLYEVAVYKGNFNFFWLDVKALEKVAFAKKRGKFYRELAASGLSNIDLFQANAKTVHDLLKWDIDRKKEKKPDTASLQYLYQSFEWTLTLQSLSVLEKHLNQQEIGISKHTYKNSAYASLLDGKEVVELTRQVSMINLLHFSTDKIQILMDFLKDEEGYSSAIEMCQLALKPVLGKFYLVTIPKDIAGPLELLGQKGNNYPEGSVGAALAEQLAS